MVVVVVAGLAATWVACVGDDPTSGGGGGPAVGDRLGACFDDGKCKQGLECRLPERICLTPGEPVPPDAGIDGSVGPQPGKDASSATDAQGDARRDAGSEAGAACVIEASPNAGPYCAGADVRCSGGMGCCTLQGTRSCTSAASCSGNFFACDGSKSCNGDRCCLQTAGPADRGQCTSGLIGSSSACSPTGACNAAIVCNSKDDCPATNCVPTRIVLDTTNNRSVVWGICQ